VNVKKAAGALLFSAVMAACSHRLCLPQEGARPVTIEECVQLGLEHSPSLHAASSTIRASEAAVRGAKALRIPALKARAEYDRLSELSQPAIMLPPPISVPVTLGSDILNSYIMQLELRQSLFTGFSIPSQIERATYFVEESRYGYQNRKLEVIHDVQEAFWNLARALEGQRILNDHISVLEDHLSDVKNFYDHGLVTYNEVLTVELQLARTRQQALRAENETRIARERLNLLTGLGNQTRTVPQVDLSSPLPEPGELHVLMEKALSENPLVLTSSKHIRRTDAELKLVDSGFYPSVYLTGSYVYGRPNPRQFPPQDEFKGSWEIGLVTELDLGSWRTLLAERQKTMSQKNQLEDELKQLRDSITLSVTNAYLTLDSVRRQISVTETAILLAEENHRIVSDKYKNGLALSSELLDAEFSLLQAKLDHTTARIDYELTLIALSRAVGARKVPEDPE
jgi:outer membrane protein